MPNIIAALTLVLLVATVVGRVFWLKRSGVAAMQFGKIDRTDFLILPFALLYFYLVFAAAFHWPSLSTQEFFDSTWLAWAGVLCCLVGLALFWFSLASFGRSFRVGIDTQNPDRLVTQGAYAHSRNPIYVAFAAVLLGQFLVFPNLILLLYLGAAAALFHRQVLREEDYLKQHYGPEFAAYCLRVRRY